MNAKSYRRLMSNWVTGVSLITCVDQEGPVGCTANALTSLSLDPPQILVCFDLTVVWAAVPLLAAAVVLRGAFAAGARWRSALLGGAVGLFAGATMNLHCPNVAPAHVVIGHGLAVLLAALLGAFALTHRTRA